jgi:hypothetical protein
MRILELIGDRHLILLLMHNGGYMRFRMNKAKASIFLSALFFSICVVTNLSAQSGTTSISGMVSDQNGSAVPGATVVLLNPDTGFSRSVVTGSDGKYNFPGIPAATYHIEVTASNFKKLVNTNAKALVDSPIELNLALEPGAVTATVDVTSNTIEAVVNTQDASLGNNFEPQQISQLPTDLRRVADLLTLQPGVTREGYVAGARSDQANVILDGVDINDQQNGGRTAQFQTSQDTVLRATAESVEEFRITTTNANANQGRSSGAQISLITKSGTNQFHGAGFYFYRPTAFSANNFFNNLDGVARPSLARDVFGGAIGGPIIKDKLFFFYTYEGQRETLGVPTCQVVPLATLGQGQLKFTGTTPSDPEGTAPHPITLSTAQLNSIYSQIPGGMNSAAIAALGSAASKYTANSSCAGDGVNTGGFRWNAPTTIAENTHIAKFNWNIDSKQSLFVRGNYQNDLTGGNAAFPDTPTTALWQHPYGFVVGHDWAISSNKFNNIRYGLTRQSFSTQGDSNLNAISFRNVFSPLSYSRTLNRITPTHNFSDDFTIIKGKHTIQLGENIRIIRNKRLDFGSAFDVGIMNNSYYGNSGRATSDAFGDAGYSIGPGFTSIVQNAATALIGRYTQYSGDFTYDLNGNVLPVGTPTTRNFATEEYDSYVQDIWKPWHNLTLTMGLRYSLDTPVYEKNGFEVVPTVTLGDFFEQRVASAANGVPYNALINFQKGGPVNNARGFYKMAWNNWQPSIAAAYTPNFGNGILKAIFGEEGKSVFRGGFRIVNDHFGEQLAVSFSALSSIGFTSSTTISPNTYDVTTNLGPLFTGFNQDIRTLPGVPAPPQRFSADVTPGCLAGTEPCDTSIEVALDGNIKTPRHYVWNVSWGRQLPGGMYFEASYIGRKARHLLAARDVMALNDLVDKQSGMDWYTAAGMLNNLRNANTPVSSVGAIPYFEHLFPGISGTFGIDGANSTQEIYGLVAHEGAGGYDLQDWTFVQSLIDDIGIYPNMFFHPQYGALTSYSSVGKSNYNGVTLSLRQRLGETLTYDINYTWSKSFDNASGLQTGSSYGSQFILNALRPDDNYAYSDFDVRNSLNANFIVQLPFGKGRQFFGDMNKYANVFLGGWQLAGIYRFNTGLPLSAPQDANQWATNWNVQSMGTLISPLTFKAIRSTRNVFADPQAALNSFRNAAPGETGPRNIFRLPGYSTLDLGLSKSFKMPWGDNHKLQLRWEVINAMNSQYFNADNFTTETYALPQDTQSADVPKDDSGNPLFGNIFTSIQGNPRRMQFGLRYSF